MKTNNNKGFTLIELIMVIVILGILSAVAVPKFFDLTASARIKNAQAVVGNIKAGLNLYAANSLVNAAGKYYPDGDDLYAATAGKGLGMILDEIPDGWTCVVEGSETDSCHFLYTVNSVVEGEYAYGAGPTSTTYNWTVITVVD